MSFDNLRLSVKLGIMIAVAVLCLASACTVSLYFSYNRMLSDRIGKVQAAGDMAVHLATALDKQVQAGTLSKTDAVQRFRDTLNAERFDDGNYIFAYGYDELAVAIPPAPQLVGHKNEAAKDDAGHSLVVGLIAAGRSAHHEYYYHYPHPGSTVPAAKVAFVADFPPWQMIVGSGVYMDDLRDEVWRTTGTLAAVAVPLLALLLGVGLLTYRSIVGGLTRLAGNMRGLSQGEHSVTISGVTRADEVGVMARTVQFFKDGIIEADRVAGEQQAAQQAKQIRAETLEAATKRFEGRVGQLVHGLAVAATQMEMTAQAMAASADQASAQALNVAASAERTAENVDSVASATDGLSSSIQDIARQVAQSADIARRAVTDAGNTSATVQTLAGGAEKIGAVVKLIQDIASKTNLLALNATIEAARAGEQGKGFAVVAGEVKNLASQTARATQDIAAQISEIQGATQRVVRAIEGIGTTITEISDIAGAIAPAVARQGAATADIAQNVQQAAARTAQVTATIEDVKTASAGTGLAAREVLTAAGSLSQHSQELNREVDRFLAEVKAA